MVWLLWLEQAALPPHSMWRRFLELQPTVRAMRNQIAQPPPAVLACCLHPPAASRWHACLGPPQGAPQRCHAIWDGQHPDVFLLMCPPLTCAHVRRHGSCVCRCSCWVTRFLSCQSCSSKRSWTVTLSWTGQTTSSATQTHWSTHPSASCSAPPRGHAWQALEAAAEAQQRCDWGVVR